MIPLSVPYLNGNEWKYVKECLDTGWISSAGSYVETFERSVAEYVGMEFGVACMNGTVGLQTSQLIAGVKPGDCVVAPNLTFVATVNSIRHVGANPILIDVDSSTWQMDLDLIEEYFEKKTTLKKDQGTWNSYRKSDGARISAMIPVHVLGNIGDMNRINELSEKYHFIVIEDAAEALGSHYNNKSAGAFGKIGVFSFNGNKIISTGGGGVMVTNDEELARKAKHITTTAKISSSDYIHDEVGFNYRLVNILAAIGVAQLEQLPDVLKKKKKVDQIYREHLEQVNDISFQDFHKNVDSNCWLSTIRANRMRQLMDYLKSERVECRPLWKPMNQLSMYKNEQYVSSEDQSRQLYESCLSIPSSAGITEKDHCYVINKIKHFYS